MSRIVLFIMILVSAVLLADSISVTIDVNCPMFRVNEGINSAAYFTSPVMQVDTGLSADFYKYYRYKPPTGESDSILWVTTYPNPRWWGVTKVDSALAMDTTGRIIICSIDTFYGKYGEPLQDSSKTRNYVNDSLWSCDIRFNELQKWPDESMLHFRENMGNNVWYYPDDNISGMVSDYLIPIAGKYARILFSGQLGRYYGSYNWKTAVGPLDEELRKQYADSCFADTLALPVRFSEYGIPEMLRICDTMDVMPSFVYTRISDTTYSIVESMMVYITESYGTSVDTTDSSIFMRKLLQDDARDFAEYLFGSPDSGWGRLRALDGCSSAVNTDRILIGNDLMVNDLLDLAPANLYDSSLAWPRYEITKALIDSGAVHFVVDSIINNYSDDVKRAKHFTLRHQARLDSIAAAFKSVAEEYGKTDLKVGAFICGLWAVRAGAHWNLGAAALAAPNIDYIGQHWYFLGGHKDAEGDKRLNYGNPDYPFMTDIHTEDSICYVNRFLLNETLGDVAVKNFFDMPDKRMTLSIKAKLKRFSQKYLRLSLSRLPSVIGMRISIMIACGIRKSAFLMRLNS